MGYRIVATTPHTNDTLINIFNKRKSIRHTTFFHFVSNKGGR